MNTIYKNIPAYLKLESESTNAAKIENRIVHLQATLKPGPKELKDTMKVHFEIPARYKGAFSYLCFRLQNNSIEWFQISCDGWADTRVGNIDTTSVLLCVRYI